MNIDLHDQAMRVLDDLEANIRTACDDLRSLLASVEPQPDITRRPYDLLPGGWIQPTGQKAWRQINDVMPCECPNGPPGPKHHARIDLRGINGAIHTAWHSRYPYLTDAEFQAQCDREAA